MDQAALRDRLLMLAAGRLKARPYDLAALRAELSDPFAQSSVTADLASVPLPVKQAAAMGAFAPLDEHLLRIIDSWAARRQVPTVEALPPATAPTTPPAAKPKPLDHTLRERLLLVGRLLLASQPEHLQAFEAEMAKPDGGSVLGAGVARDLRLVDWSGLRIAAAMGEPDAMDHKLIARITEWAESLDRVQRAAALNAGAQELADELRRASILESMRRLVPREASPPKAAPEQGRRVVRHTFGDSGRIADLLTPLIYDAMTEVGDYPARVFTLLQAWAREAPPRRPLRGVTETGVQWIGADDGARELTLKQLRDRMRRRRKRAP
jgi:hypothetical protein